MGMSSLHWQDTRALCLKIQSRCIVHSVSSDKRVTVVLKVFLIEQIHIRRNN